MCVDAVGQIAGDHRRFDSDDSFRDQFPGPCPDDSHAQNSLGFRIEQDLCDAFRASQRLSST